MIEGFIQGLKARRPALFNLYSSCQPEHGIGDDLSSHQAKLAVESRAYPLFRYDPDAGKTPAECFDLEGNPAIDDVWPTYKLRYKSGRREKELEVPMTFVDFAITEVRFRKHFRVAPPDTWNDNMVPLHEFLELDADGRDGKFPFVWSVDREDNLTRLLVAKPMVESAEDRRDFWTMMKALAGVEASEEQVTREEIEAQARQEVVGRIAAGLMRMAGGDTDPGLGLTDLAAAPQEASADAPAAAGNDNGMKPWLDTEECTSCDECIQINPKIFAYNDDKKAYIQNAAGGPYRDLVKSAEKCTARVIHPGLPADRSEKDIDKWIARGEKYN
jgi:pyruvate-ferredoxin/flavodoxin oxidoreductase